MGEYQGRYPRDEPKTERAVSCVTKHQPSARWEWEGADSRATVCLRTDRVALSSSGFAHQLRQIRVRRPQDGAWCAQVQRQRNECISPSPWCRRSSTGIVAPMAQGRVQDSSDGSVLPCAPVARSPCPTSSPALPRGTSAEVPSSNRVSEVSDEQRKPALSEGWPVSLSSKAAETGH